MQLCRHIYRENLCELVACADASATLIVFFFRETLIVLCVVVPCCTKNVVVSIGYAVSIGLNQFFFSDNFFCASRQVVTST